MSSDTAVIIPVYNRQNVILDTLDSVLRQTLQPTELIVVDDGSTDNSVEAVARWVREARPQFGVKLIQEAKGSAAAARNAGMDHMSPLSFVAFLDSDDWWPIDFLARTVPALRRHPGADAISADRRYTNPQGEVFQFDDCRALADDPVTWLFLNGAGVASSTLLRTSAVNRVDRWPDWMVTAEDARLFVRIALGGQWLHSPGDPVDFFQGERPGQLDEGNLSRRHLDSYHRWAHAYESIYESLRETFPERKRRRLRPLLAVYWYRAGKQFQRRGHFEDARRCFRKAIARDPLMIKARFRQLRVAA